MAKNRGNIGGVPGGMKGGMGGMMRQIQKMQEDMQSAQEQLAHETVETTVGGGAVKVVITGHQRVQSVTINPASIDTTDAEWVTKRLGHFVAMRERAQEAVIATLPPEQAAAARRVLAAEVTLAALPDTDTEEDVRDAKAG